MAFNIVRKWEVEGYFPPGITASAQIYLDTDDVTMFAVYLIDSRIKDKPFTYEIKFNCRWLQHLDTLTWLSEVLADDLLSTLLKAQSNLRESLCTQLNTIKTLIGY
jgi:hypothetical protein